ncbi:MAG: 2,3-bisphosphoglycerate-independent phosphoglycerate mutase, partial [Patescibacteria group bacterium]
MSSSSIKSKTQKTPGLLIILDGWGIAPPNRGNAVALAKTRTMDWLYKNYPSIKTLCAHGACAGLPDPQTGNSEAGHLNIGAGRLVESENVMITEEIKSGHFFRNPAFLEAVNHIKYHKSKIHLMGLITENDSAHSSPNHWMAMLKLLLNEGVENIYIHLFTDGRDSSQHAAIKLIKRFEKKANGVKNHNHADDQQKIIVASVCGRFYAMDRIKNWSAIEKVYDAIILGHSEVTAETADEAIVQAYNRGETDEFIKPTVIVDKNGKALGVVEDRDAVIFMNLRSDRARELTKVFVQKDFMKMNSNSFRRKKYLENLLFVAMTSFGPDLDN